LVMLIAYVIVVLVPPLRELAEFALLGVSDYIILALIALGWGLALRTIWRRRLLGRFLGVDLQ